MKSITDVNKMFVFSTTPRNTLMTFLVEIFFWISLKKLSR